MTSFLKWLENTKVKTTILKVEIDIHIHHPKMRFQPSGWADKTKKNWIDTMEDYFQNADWKNVNTQHNWDHGELNFDIKYFLPSEIYGESVQIILRGSPFLV